MLCTASPAPVTLRLAPVPFRPCPPVIVTTPDEAIVHWLEPKEVMKKWHQWEKKANTFWSNDGTNNKISA